MASNIHYQVSLGSQSASNKPRKSTQQLISLKVELSMDGVGGRCDIELANSNQAGVAAGDPVTVDLDCGEGEVRVFTGAVENTQVTSTTQRILANDALLALTRLDVEAAFEDVNVDFIVKQLLSDAGITPGDIEQGPKLSSYALHKGPRAFRHIQHLAKLCGADFFSDGEGRAHLLAASAKANKYCFRYGENVMALDLNREPPVFDSVELWGEGAASSSGAETYYWLASDISGVSAKASVDKNGQVKSNSLGKRVQRLQLGEIRSGEAAQAVADARMAALAAQRVKGYIKVFAAPKVLPGDHIEITGLPNHHGASRTLKQGEALRVRSVQHLLNRSQGLVSRMDF